MSSRGRKIINLSPRYIPSLDASIGSLSVSRINFSRDSLSIKPIAQSNWRNYRRDAFQTIRKAAENWATWLGIDDSQLGGGHGRDTGSIIVIDRFITYTGCRCTRVEAYLSKVLKSRGAKRLIFRAVADKLIINFVISVIINFDCKFSKR